VAKALGAEQFAEAGWHGVVDLGGAREVTLTVTVWPAPGEPPVDLGPLPLRVSRHHGGVEPELDEGAPNRFHGALELPPRAPLSSGTRSTSWVGP